MLLSDAKFVLNEFMNHGVHLSTILWGETGIGKSSIIKQLGRDRKMKIFDIRLSQREAVDILGLPWTKKSKFKNRKSSGQNKQVTYKKDGMADVVVTVPDPQLHLDEYEEVDVLGYHAPEWFVEALMEGNCIIFLDELNRARRETLQGVFELCLDRSLNGRKLPDDVFIYVACNPPSAQYDTVKFDPALIARFMHLQCTMDTPTWLKWAKEVNLETSRPNIKNPHVISYIERNPAALQNIIKNANFPVDVQPNPRCWEFVSEVDMIDTINDGLKEECLRGLVGAIHAASYMKQRNEIEKVISLEEIFELNDSVKSRISFLKNESKDPNGRVRLDIFKVTVDNIVKEEVRCRAHYKKVVDFLELIPSDLAMSTLKRIFRNPASPWADELVNNRPAMFARFKQAEDVRKNTTKLGDASVGAKPDVKPVDKKPSGTSTSFLTTKKIKQSKVV